MANGKCAVIGDRDSILLFKAVGIEVYPVTDGEQANKTLHRLARHGYAVVYVTEALYPACGETIREFQGEAYPAIIPIPDASGTQGIGMRSIKENVEKAVGLDILSNS
jgi:V/A-type H+-transporting ATPase subunit F